MSELPGLIINGMLTGGLHALIALPMVLVYKATQVVSIAHGQILALGAFIFWLTLHWLPFGPSLIICLVLIGLLGFIIERLALRPLIGQPLFSAFMVTFGLFMFFDGIFQLLLVGKARAIPVFFSGSTEVVGATVSISDVGTFGISLAIFLTVWLFFRYSKVGLGMRATAEDHRLAQSAGINVRLIFSIAWIFSAVVAALAGITAAQVVSVYISLPWMIVKGLVVALVGGLDSMRGALVAGLILGVLERIAAFYVDPLVGGGTAEIVPFILLLFIVLARPYGLFGLARIERI